MLGHAATRPILDAGVNAGKHRHKLGAANLPAERRLMDVKRKVE